MNNSINNIYIYVCATHAVQGCMGMSREYRGYLSVRGLGKFTNLSRRFEGFRFGKG